MTSDLYNLNLLAKLMVLLRQILFILAITAIAETILMRNSAEQVPSLGRVTPKYFKLVTSSNFWPFMQSTYFVRAAGQDFALCCADFPSICCCSVYESVRGVLKLTIAKAHVIDVVSES